VFGETAVKERGGDYGAFSFFFLQLDRKYEYVTRKGTREWDI
jgi:hypothetical protein